MPGFSTAFSICRRTSSSWMQRHVNDPFVKQAFKDGYRARSAYKLIQLDDRFGLLKPGMAVVECGAAPGAWTQVACARVKADGIVVACDLLHLDPVPGATILSGVDFTLASTQAAIVKALGGRKPDVVLSDMAPNASGMSGVDHDRIVALAHSALRFAALNLTPGGAFVCKIWSGGSANKLVSDMKTLFGEVRTFKPESSRKESAETYLLAKDFMSHKDAEKRN